ncbi:hypothetical protein JHU04_004361 [Brenneria sp. 4F2]|nr:hypothetical protein [Brenneria bubanii]
MWENELMYYILMNDYGSSLIPRYLHVIVDFKKQVNDKWEYESSKESFPNYMLESTCPNTLYLLCRKDVGALKFSYYNHGMGHIMSKDFFEKINSIETSHFVAKDMIATSIKDGSVLRDDLKYVYFLGNEDFIDISKSKLEEDKRGNLVPYDISFNKSVTKYGLFSINKTLLHHFLFLSELSVDVFSKVNGLKIVPLNSALNNYCSDYGYDLEGNKKRVRKKLP